MGETEQDEAGPVSSELPTRRLTWACVAVHLVPLVLAGAASAASWGLVSLTVFLVPLVVMLGAGSRSRLLRAHAVEELNWQLTLLVLASGLLAVAVLLGAVGSDAGFVVLVVLTFGVPLWSLAWSGLVTWHAARGNLRRYPALRLVR